MNIQDIENYLTVSKFKTICIERSLFSYYPGFVRDISIENDNKVIVAFNTYGYDEGGLEIELSYMNINTLSSNLETFLNKLICKWDNITRSGYYPECPEKVNFDLAAQRMLEDLKLDKIKLPEGWVKMKVLPEYWLEKIKE